MRILLVLYLKLVSIFGSFIKKEKYSLQYLKLTVLKASLSRLCNYVSTSSHYSNSKFPFSHYLIMYQLIYLF